MVAIYYLNNFHNHPEWWKDKVPYYGQIDLQFRDGYWFVGGGVVKLHEWVECAVKLFMHPQTKFIVRLLSPPPGESLPGELVGRIVLFLTDDLPTLKWMREKGATPTALIVEPKHNKIIMDMGPSVPDVFVDTPNTTYYYLGKICPRVGWYNLNKKNSPLPLHIDFKWIATEDTAKATTVTLVSPTEAKPN